MGTCRMCFGLSQRSPSVDNPIVVAALMLVLIMQRNCTPESWTRNFIFILVLIKMQINKYCNEDNLSPLGISYHHSVTNANRAVKLADKSQLPPASLTQRWRVQDLGDDSACHHGSLASSSGDVISTNLIHPWLLHFIHFCVKKMCLIHS